jgi:hypothetical protein
MQRLLMALLVTVLLAAPSLGVINIKVVADSPVLSVGQSTVVRIFAQGTNAGVFALGGYIEATGSTDWLTTVGTMSFDSLYSPAGLFPPKAYPGTTNYAKGGFGDATPVNSGFGTQQTDWGTPIPSCGRDEYVQVCHYTIVADGWSYGSTNVTLRFVPKTIAGYKPLEVDKTGILGLVTPAVITTPEPMTLVLLALGGLAAARRRVRG